MLASNAGMSYQHMQQIGDINLAKQWKRIEAPVLVIDGTSSLATSADESRYWHYQQFSSRRRHLPRNRRDGHDFGQYDSQLAFRDLEVSSTSLSQLSLTRVCLLSRRPPFLRVETQSVEENPRSKKVDRFAVRRSARQTGQTTSSSKKSAEKEGRGNRRLTQRPVRKRYFQMICSKTLRPSCPRVKSPCVQRDSNSFGLESTGLVIRAGSSLQTF